MNPGRARSLMTLAGAVGTAFVLGCVNTTDSNQNDESLALSQAGSHQEAWNGKTAICHIPPGNPANAHTITVGNAAVSAHLAHGDKLGACVDTRPAKKPCSDHAGKGKSHGGLGPKLRAGKVAVCHIPPGNPANEHTITIGEAAVNAHLAHGDHLGVCGEESSEVSTPASCGDHGNSGNHGDGGSSGEDDSTSTDGGDGGSGSGGSTDQPPVANY